jgi:hypothetical protein
MNAKHRSVRKNQGLVDSGATPLRLPLGSDSYDGIRAALVTRLAEHEAQRDVAFSVVRDEPW